MWHRWDPHLHAPGTLLGDQFGGDWESYLRQIEIATPPVRALGVTDYFCIETYRQARMYKSTGRLPHVELLFPNVEMRLDLKTEKRKPINIHLLFSPDDPRHETEIERILGHLTFEFRERQYRCTLLELAELGRAFDPRQTDNRGALRTGAGQFKVTLQDLKQLFRTEVWLRQNCLIAVAGGQGDGTAGLREDDSFAATRREIEASAHIIFAASPKQRDFWLGHLPHADRSFIERTYIALKPCLHGSDAHRDEAVGTPELDRYCWLKGDLAFETLRQVVIEPAERVWLGAAAPPDPTPSVRITEVRALEASWLKADNIALNPGLVAIIGSRGSGKTALVDLIAAAAGALGSTLGESSFLKRASSPVDLLGNARVELTWGGGAESRASLWGAVNGETSEAEGVCYLSQHFVERLCSSSGLAIELRREMERVVFEATEPTDRLEADSFDVLASILLEPILNRRAELRSSVCTVAQQLVQDDLLRDRLPALQRDAETLRNQIATARKELASLLPKGKEERARRLVELEAACTNAEGRVEALRRRRKLLDDLAADVAQTRASREPVRYAEMQRRFGGTGMPPEDWLAFSMVFAGDVDAILRREMQAVDRSITLASEGDASTGVDLSNTPLSGWALKDLRDTRDKVKKEAGIDVQQQKTYDDLQRAIGKYEASLRRLETDIKHASGAHERRGDLITSRRAMYAEVFRTLVAEEEILRRLYSPLQRSLASSAGALAKLAFVIQRQVDLDAWVEKGEKLLDLRRESRFRGHGTLRKEASQYLLQAWTHGAADDVAVAMDTFRTEFQGDLLRARPASVAADEHRAWTQSVADWLYDTSHIRVQYGIHYDGVAIEQLSPGTRGIVLLLLYLAVDQHDRRPLIVDQPEENLDPNSVFEELVPHFRAARRRRQVIVVTHNANLVVNTDADQVIVAESKQTAETGLPRLSYRGGSLENPEIRTSVCRLLEGGERAFLERERRYRLRWGETLPFPV